MLKRIADQKLSTINPGTIWAARRIKSAFITSAKSPKVIMVMGRVKIRRIGLKIALIIPKTTARIRAVIKLLTWIPGRKYAARIIAIASSSQLIKIMSIRLV